MGDAENVDVALACRGLIVEADVIVRVKEYVDIRIVAEAVEKVHAAVGVVEKVDVELVVGR